MGKDYTSEELAWRTFLVSMIGIGGFIATVFIFIL
jgi:hypothetical protein